MEQTRGYQTTEFFTHIIVLAMGFALVLLGKLSGEMFFGVAIGGGAGYTGLRTLLKIRRGNNDKEEKPI